jgi:hypothetical protein
MSIIFASTLVFIGGVLFDFYFFLNMTDIGLTNALVIFALSIIFDLILLRNITVAIISIVIVKRNNNI